MTLERTNLPSNCLGVILVFDGDNLSGYVTVDEDTGILESKAVPDVFSRNNDEPFYLPLNSKTETIDFTNKEIVMKYGYKDSIPDDVIINKTMKELLL